MKGSNFNSSTFRQISVQGNLFSGGPSCFKVFQSFLGFGVFSFSFSSKYAFFFFKWNCELCFVPLYRFLAISSSCNFVDLNFLQSLSLAGFDLTFQKWFVNLPDENNLKTDLKYCPRWFGVQKHFSPYIS